MRRRYTGGSLVAIISIVIIALVNNKVNTDKSVLDTNYSIPTILYTSESSAQPTPVIYSGDTRSDFDYSKYTEISVEGGDLSGDRKPNARVNIGFGNREYWAYTNEYGQLIRVEADVIILQDPSKEPVNDSGRYYPDEAKVPGTERPDLDEGHVIADSLGGVSNAYNITPQNSTLNRHGDQAYMEKVIRDAGGCENFLAEITYPDTATQIPSKYKYTYTVKGNRVVDEFANANPEK